MTSLAVAWEVAGDGRAVFVDCYARMTAAVGVALGAGRFEDAEWVDELMERFAVRYFASIDGGDDNAPVAEPWIVAHAAAVGNDASTLQLLLAGVNAHICYDLVLTLVEMLEPEWSVLGDCDLDRRHGDFDRINEIMKETADAVQDEVVERRSPGLGLLDRAMGSWDERAAVTLLSRWRDRVWRDAVGMLDRPEHRAADVERLAARCARRGRWILI